MKKIVIALDSLKGCLDSYQASMSVAEGIQKAWPNANIIYRPVSDGGERMVEMMAMKSMNKEFHHTSTIGPLGGKVNPMWIVRKEPDGRWAYMDFSSASGLTLIEEKRRNPLHSTSYGVGRMIDDALRNGVKGIRLGLGGSATVDAALGALQALGLRLLDFRGHDLPAPFTGEMLSEVGDLVLTTEFIEKVSKMKLHLLCDVETPFTGENGAARIFGPQKGANPKDVEGLEKGMENVRHLILDKTGIDLNAYPGSGAAGGAAGGLMALAGGKIRKGAPTLLELSGFEKEIEGADLIITGEGSSDRQTLMGKIPYEILRRGQRRGIPVWLVAGRVSDEEALKVAGFARIICINSPSVIRMSNTIGQNPMNPKVAAKRLSCLMAD